MDAHEAQLREVEEMGRRKDEGVAFDDVVATRATDLALLVRLGPRNGHKEIWIPKSVIHEDSEINEVDDEGILVLSTWFVEKEGIL